MAFTDVEMAFLENQHTAAMITLGSDGFPKAARVGVAVVDGRIWSSGTTGRVRTRRLREDPRCTLFVFDAQFSWLALETTVTILEGADAPALNLQLFRVMQQRPTGPLSWFGGELDGGAFMQQMVREGRLIYEFDVHRSYGLP
jgi:Pyridoxamine 5'-phosphate oxidase